jgi:hypothetical protein
MTKNVAVVESGHSDFRNHHLQESRKGREDTELIRSETKTCSCRKVAALHDAGWNKNFRMLLVDDF